MSGARIVRPPLPSDNFVIIDRLWTRDPGLSTKDKGLLMYLLSHHEDYDLGTDQIVRENEDGKDSILSGLRRLEGKGWLIRERLRREDDSGKFDGWIYTITVPQYMLDRAAAATAAKSRRGSDLRKRTTTGKSRPGSDLHKPDLGRSGPQRENPDTDLSTVDKSAPIEKTNGFEETNGENTTPPAPRPDATTRRDAAEVSVETGGVVPEDLLIELAELRPDWLASDIVAALSHPDVAEREIKHPGLPVAALRLLAADVDGKRYEMPTYKPTRLRQSFGRWWLDALTALRPPAPVMYAPRLPGQPKPAKRRCAVSGCHQGRIAVPDRPGAALACPDCKPGTHLQQLNAARQQADDVGWPEPVNLDDLVAWVRREPVTHTAAS